MAENAAVDASTFLKNIASLTLGSGKTTEEEGNPTALNNIQSLLATIMPQITGTAQTDAVVQNIMTRAAQAFMPVSFAGNNQSGLYNSSAVKALQGEAMARAVGESSAAVLQHQTDAAKTAASLANASVNASKTTTKTTAPAIHPLVSGAITAAMFAKSMLGKKKDDGESDTPSVRNPYSPDGGGGGAPSTSNVTNPGDSISSNSLSSNADELTTASDTSPSSLIAAPDAGVASADRIADASVAPGNVPGLGNFYPDGSPVTTASLANGDADYLATLADTGSGGTAFGGAGALDNVGGSTASYLADTAEIGSEGATVLGGTEGVVEGVSLVEEVLPYAAASAVICTELKAQKILDEKLWASGGWYNKDISAYTKVGYHFWAVPYVRVMRKSALATRLVTPFAIGRYKYLAGEKNFCGMLTVKIGEPVCYAIGKLIAPLLLDLPSTVE